MSSLNIRLRKIKIVPDHIECAMTENFLESEYIAAVSQVLDSKGVPEAVGVNILNSGRFSYAAQDALDIPFRRRKQALFGPAFGYVSPYRFKRAGADEYHARFGFDASRVRNNYDLAGLQIDVFETYTAKFPNPDPRVKESEDDRSIPNASFSALTVCAVAFRGWSYSGSLESRKYAFYLGVSEWPNLGEFVLWSCKSIGGTGYIQFLLDETEEGPDSLPVIVDGWSTKIVRSKFSEPGSEHIFGDTLWLDTCVRKLAKQLCIELDSVGRPIYPKVH